MHRLDPNKDTSPIKFFLKVNRKEIPLIILDIILYTIGTAVIIGLAGLLGEIVDKLNSHDQVSTIIWLIIGALILSELCYRIGHIIEIQMRVRLKAKIKETLFNHTRQLSFDYFSDRFAGEIAHKVSQTADAFEWLVLIVTDNLTNSIGVILFSAVLLGKVNTSYAIFLIIWFIIFMLGILKIARLMNQRSATLAKQETHTTGKLVDTYSNIQTVKVYGQDDNSKSVSNQIKIEAQALKSFGWAELGMFIWQGIFLIILGFGLILMSINLYTNSLITIGGIVVVSTIGLRLYATVWGWGPSLASFVRHNGEINQNLSDLVVSPKIVDKKETQDIIDKKIGIEYRNVNFSYHEERLVLHNFMLKIKPQEKIGIVGLSGAGKTTFVNLLLRFFEVQSGEILLNDINIENFTQDFLRSQISYISQDTSLFHATVTENISYGSKNVSSNQIQAAAKLAFADEFIKDLPGKYQSIVGERGVKLSGGQRQRIAIARAILADRPIFLIDEATSALDSNSEDKIQKALGLLMKDKTVIAIAHRLSTLSNMDRIIYLENGKIVETGTHSQLLKLNGHYAKLWHHQAGGFLLDD